jgi:hypothetical protein
MVEPDVWEAACDDHFASETPFAFAIPETVDGVLANLAYMVEADVPGDNDLLTPEQKVACLANGLGSRARYLRALVVRQFGCARPAALEAPFSGISLCPAGGWKLPLYCPGQRRTIG